MRGWWWKIIKNRKPIMEGRSGNVDYGKQIMVCRSYLEIYSRSRDR
jgi:hypothetical protein